VLDHAGRAEDQRPDVPQQLVQLGAPARHDTDDVTIMTEAVVPLAYLACRSTGALGA
jgi:hypothetical protein